MVMMTNGWRRFDLNKINDTARFRPTQPVERDLFISGHVKWIVGMKAKNAPVIAVSSGKNGIISQSVKTDKKGDFRIGGLEFHDTAKFFVYSQTAKGKPMQGIEIDSYYSRPGFERMHPFTERKAARKSITSKEPSCGESTKDAPEYRYRVPCTTLRDYPCSNPSRCRISWPEPFR